MADLVKFSFLFLLSAFFLFVELTFSADPPQISPSPSPGADDDSPSPFAPTADVPAPLHAPASSPTAPSPETPSPAASPNPSPASSPSPSPSPSLSPSEAPAPAPADSAELNHADVGDETEGDSSGEMSPGKKAGIAVGVIAAGCVVGLAGIVYKKRQQNIRRSQFGNAARREIL